MVPLYKCGERNLTNNYRPISLLPTLSKLLERIVYNRVYTFLDKTGQLYQSQYGFRSKHSCENAIQELLGRILKSSENKEYTAAIFLDLSKAFDSLEHHVLLEKMKIYGIRGIANDWFVNYLKDRKMRVKVVTDHEGSLTYSNPKPVTYGIPQGSCLGPLCFLIFCNDLPLNLLYCSSILFADDTTVYKSHSNIRYLEWQVSEELKHLLDWFRANKLTLNLDKSCCILFSIGKKDPESFSINVDNVSIPVTDCTKFLGVWIDKTLNWQKQFTTVLLKVKRNTNMLKSSRNFLDIQSKKIVYFAHIQSHLCYCVSVWGNFLTDTQRNQLQKQLNTCIQFISSTRSANELGILTFDKLLKLENCKFGYKVTNGLLPKAILECAITDHKGMCLKKCHDYNTRNKSTPNQPKIKNKKYGKSVFCIGSSEFVKLTSELKSRNNVVSFTKLCKKMLLHEKL